MKISRREPVRAIVFMDGIMEETRQKILQLLIEKGEVPVSEIQSTLNKTYSTILSHLDILEKAGLVSWKWIKRGRKPQKAYYIHSKLVDLEIDLEIFAKVLNLKKLRELAKKLIELERNRNKFKRNYSVSEIMSILGIDSATALALRNYMDIFEDEIVKTLFKIFIDELSGEKLELRELAEKMNIDEYWAARILKAI